jgi:hypothetical protein
MVYNICSLSVDAKQMAFSARPRFHKVVTQGLTGLTGRWGYFFVVPATVTNVLAPHLE